MEPGGGVSKTVMWGDGHSEKRACAPRSLQACGFTGVVRHGDLG